ncbi:hypothetical protein BDZ91DRAFT_827022 [Kalaharituber pfeilii]|nr:hypothetical protein BDZ91DRAFT_827022 [Kalaharituber pfeilii]
MNIWILLLRAFAEILIGSFLQSQAGWLLKRVVASQSVEYDEAGILSTCNLHGSDTHEFDIKPTWGKILSLAREKGSGHASPAPGAHAAGVFAREHRLNLTGAGWTILRHRHLHPSGDPPRSLRHPKTQKIRQPRTPRHPSSLIAAFRMGPAKQPLLPICVSPTKPAATKRFLSGRMPTTKHVLMAVLMTIFIVSLLCDGTVFMLLAATQVLHLLHASFPTPSGLCSGASNTTNAASAALASTTFQPFNIYHHEPLSKRQTGDQYFAPEGTDLIYAQRHEQRLSLILVTTCGCLSFFLAFLVSIYPVLKAAFLTYTAKKKLREQEREAEKDRKLQEERRLKHEKRLAEMETMRLEKEKEKQAEECCGDRVAPENVEGGEEKGKEGEKGVGEVEIREKDKEHSIPVHTTSIDLKAAEKRRNEEQGEFW